MICQANWDSGWFVAGHTTRLIFDGVILWIFIGWIRNGAPEFWKKRGKRG